MRFHLLIQFRTLLGQRLHPILSYKRPSLDIDPPDDESLSMPRPVQLVHYSCSPRGLASARGRRFKSRQDPKSKRFQVPYFLPKAVDL